MGFFARRAQVLAMAALLRLDDGDRRRFLDASGLLHLRLDRLRPAQYVGGVHHEFRLLGRYRALGDTYFGSALSVSRALAHGNFPPRRGDDGLRRRDSRPLPADPSGTSLVFLLAGAVPE